MYVITDEDLLLRRFPLIPEFLKLVNGIHVPSSAAFKTKRGENGLSVNIRAITIDYGVFISDKNYFRIAQFFAALPLDNGFDCQYDPNPSEDPENDAHALIVGNTNHRNLAKK